MIEFGENGSSPGNSLRCVADGSFIIIIYKPHKEKEHEEKEKKKFEI